MADPRLQWRQLNQAQPNVAGLMQGSNDSLMAAGEAAKGILASYQAGAEDKAHNELLRRTGGKTQEEITQMYQAGAFDDLNLGEKGLVDLRDTITRRSDIDYTNSNTRNTDARTANTYQTMDQSRDKHGIFMREDGRMVGQRDWLEDNAGAVVNDRLGGLNNGSDLTGGQEVDWSRYAVGGAASRPDTFSGLNPEFRGRMSQMLAEAEAQGLDLRITSGYRDATVQADIVSQNMEKYGLGARTAEWQRDVQEMGPEAAGEKWRPIMREAGLTKFVAMPGGSQHQKGNAVDFADANGSLLRDPNSPQAQWLKQNAARFGLAVPMDHEPWQVELDSARSGAEPSRGFGGDQTAARMAASGLFTPAEIRAQQSPLEEAATRGDALNEEQRAADILDQTLLTAESMSLDPNITTKEAFIRQGREEMLQTGLDMSEPEIYALEQRLSEIYDGSPLLQENLTPGESTAEQLIRQTQQADQQTDIGLARGAVGGTPEAQLTVDAEGFAGMSTSTEKSSALIDQFRLMDDDFENNPIFGRDADFDPATMDQHIQRAHRELRKSDPDLTIDEVYALASRVFQADPWGKNSLEKQVSIDRMEELLGTYSTDGGRNFAEARNNIDRVDREMTLNASQEAQIQSQLRRSAVQNDPELKRRYEEQLKELRGQRESLVKELEQYSSIVEEEEAREAATALATPGPGASVRRVQ